MPSAPCAIWKTPAEQLEKAGDHESFDSPRAGGKYWVSGTAIGQLNPLTDQAKRLLTTWLCEQRRLGDEVPKVQSGILELVKARQPMAVSARLTAALKYFGQTIKQLGDFLLVGDNADSGTFRFLAETESQNAAELLELCRMLEQTGYIEGTQIPGKILRMRPTAGGWAELERLSRPRADSSQAFVAMWFNGATDDAYFKGIVPALSATGYKSVRIDKKEHNNKIDDEIIAEIRRSRFLVADFTCEPEHVRGGVYYEAGFAQGIGIPVIWTCKDSSINDLHFDTRQYAHIVWKTPVDLFEQLKNRIGATIGDGPLPKQR